MNLTLNKYNNQYFKIANRFEEASFDVEYTINNQSKDIVFQALNRNKYLTSGVFYTATCGFQLDFLFDSQCEPIPIQQKSTSFFENSQHKMQKNINYIFDNQKQKIIINELHENFLQSSIKVPLSTQIVEINLPSKHINDSQMPTIISNIDFFNNYHIKELILNLSNNPIKDNAFMALINHLPTLPSIQNITFNVENTQITDSSLRSLHLVIGHLLNLKNMKLFMKQTQITEQQSLALIDLFSDNDTELEIDCDFEKVAKYSSENKQNEEYQGKKAKKKQMIKATEKKNASSQNIVSQEFSIQNEVHSFQNSNGNILQPQNTSKQNQSLQEEDVKRKSPEEIAVEKTYEDGYGKGFKILMGLGFKVGKGLGKNDQGIVEPVQAQNKSKFKENNQSKASTDYFESISSKTSGLTNMVKFEKKQTLIVNQKLGDQDGDDEQNAFIDKSSKSSKSKGEQPDLTNNSTQSQGSANEKQQLINPYQQPSFNSNSGFGLTNSYQNSLPLQYNSFSMPNYYPNAQSYATKTL